ncbi:MAG TPA: S41 family peptidase [Bryobacteraceae bacterium]|nr:S41 family peptidase [Bryobacteraceae bacterium]
MNRFVVGGFLSALLLCAQQQPLPALSEPAVAPNRPEIIFVSSGDIWTAPLAGGEARLLVSHPATESRPLYSPDGTRIAFTSNRTGNGDVYVLTLATGQVQRLTFHEAPERADAWSADGRFVYFHSARADIAGMNDILRVDAKGGTPMLVSGDRYASEYFAAPAPVGDALAMTARGVVAAQWWRKGHSHIDESEIWIRRGNDQYERVTQAGAKSAWPMWSADGKRLFYMSDRSGAENLYEAPGKQITRFRDGRLLWPSISWDGRTVVFERDFGIWRCDVGSGKTQVVPITLRGAAAVPGPTRAALAGGFSDLALSPDGRKLAFIVRGDLFAASARDAGVATRLTATSALEESPLWLSDNRRVVYTSDRDGVPHLFLYDISRSHEAQLTKGTGVDSAPVPSPDGRTIAFVRDGSKLMTVDVSGGTEREVASAHLDLPPIQPSRSVVWSPDGKWLAYTSVGQRGFRNVSIVSAAGGTPMRASFLPNAFSNSLSWSPDGKYILFDTGQRTETGRLARIDLVPRTPRFREDQFRELFREDPTRVTPAPATPTTAPSQPASTASSIAPAAIPTPLVDAKPAPAVVQVVAEGIRQRLSLVQTGVDLGWHRVSPDGKSLLLIATVAGQTNLWQYSLDDLARDPAVARQLTSTAGSKDSAWFTPDGKEVYFLENGWVQVLTVESRQVRPVPLVAELEIDFEKDKEEIFRQSWTYLRDHFYDEKYHGVDWHAVRDRVSPYVAGSRTPDDLRRVLSLAIGELNASHLGISAPLAQNERNGNLGLRFDRGEYETHGRLRVAEVIRLSPADVAGIRVGEYVVNVDGTEIKGGVSLDDVLEHKTGKRVLLRVAATPGDQGREVAVLPVSGAQEKTLLYRHWVEQRRAYVHKESGGRLGYVHMPDMSAGSLDQLYIDLDTENQSREGVVFDLRNNSGGFVNVYALDVLARRPFLNMTERGRPTVPARSALGQRSLEKPTVLVVNQHSLSDAEDFTEGYRALKLGRVVGEPTAGWIVYTWNTTLVDGSTLRLPRVRITDTNGSNMELNPRPVDVPVLRPVGESYTGRDSQLDMAVRELLRDLDSPKQNVSGMH